MGDLSPTRISFNALGLRVITRTLTCNYVPHFEFEIPFSIVEDMLAGFDQIYSARESFYALGLRVITRTLTCNYAWLRLITRILE